MELTEEQRQIVEHPDNCHGKVLSVAGSGKTTAMAYRVRHLLQTRRIPRRAVQALMFNRLAWRQFGAKLAEIGLSREGQPGVDTFHGFCRRFLDLEQGPHWYGDGAELMRLNLLKAIDKVRKAYELADDLPWLDLESAEQAISLWKNALTPPERAGYRGPFGEVFVAIYREYEKARIQARAVTFDDFAPLAVARLSDSGVRRELGLDRLRYIIVDEYQDVNLAQQRLLEVLAADGADLMVVGDDDQTIYEWRGARADYILGEFQSVFANKPHRVYKLTNSFRFGYMVAQGSSHVAQQNSRRLEKRVVAADLSRETDIAVFYDEPGAEGSANKELAAEILTLARTKGVAPGDIRVLGRTYAQLNGLCAEFLLEKIPFKVLGAPSLLTAPETQALLDYVRAAAGWGEVLTPGLAQAFLNIANKPSRFLARRDLEPLLAAGRREGLTLGATLEQGLAQAGRWNSMTAAQGLTGLMQLLAGLAEMLAEMPVPLAGPLLRETARRSELPRHYENYYGRGESSLKRVETLNSFIAYAGRSALAWPEFLDHVAGLDTTLGLPEAAWIKLATVHSSKGLEFDYVFLPDCREGYMPVQGVDGDPTFDKENPARRPRAAEWIENERRLFYVAATRARRGLYIGAPAPWPAGKLPGPLDSKYSRFLEEMELEPVRAVAAELGKARRGEPEELAAVCRRYAAFHALLRPLQEFYARQLPGEIAAAVRAVELAAAERPFQYRQNYDSPLARQELAAAADPGMQGDLWSHLGPVGVGGNPAGAEGDGETLEAALAALAAGGRQFLDPAAAAAGAAGFSGGAAGRRRPDQQPPRGLG